MKGTIITISKITQAIAIKQDKIYLKWGSTLSISNSNNNLMLMIVMMSKTLATWLIELTGWPVKRQRSWLSNHKTTVSSNQASMQRIKGFTRMGDVLIRPMFMSSSSTKRKIKHSSSQMERMALSTTNGAPWILFHRWQTLSVPRSTTKLPRTALKLWCHSQRWEVRLTTITKVSCNTVTPSWCKITESSRHQKRTRQCSKKVMPTFKRCSSQTCSGKTPTMTLRQAQWVGMISKACWVVFETRPITSRTTS